jgi:hypothetical protein
MDIKKLRLSWNVGIGEFPRHKLRQRFGVLFARMFGSFWTKPFRRKNNLKQPLNTGEFSINARLGYQKRESIAFQRRFQMKKLAQIDNVLIGKVKQAQFNKEIHNSKIIFSPFGWGELCFRDFEAVLSGSLLIKPDMSHLETWPNIFVPNETYIPINWDGSDLIEKCEEYLQNEKERKRISKNAYEHFISQESKLNERFNETMSEIIGE